MSTLAHRARPVRLLLIIAASLAALIALGAVQADAAYRFTGVTVDPSSLQAGGHPAAHFVLDPDAANADNTGGDDLKRVVFDYAAGQVINPRVITTRCTSAQLSADNCPAVSTIGTVAASWRVAGLQKAVTGTVYVLSTTTAGSDASLGFVLRGSGLKKKSFTGQLTNGLTSRPTADAAFGPQLVIDPLPRTITSSIGLTLNATIDSLTIDLGPRAGGSSSGAFVSTTPTSCSPASGRASGVSFKNVAAAATDTFTPTGCEAVPFAPTASVAPTTTNTTSGLNLNVTLPAADQTPQQSQLKQIKVKLPTNSQINFPSLASIPTCNAAQFATDSCPNLTRLGTISLQTPLAAAALTGDVYLLVIGPTPSLGYVLRGPNGKIYGNATISQVGDSAQLDLIDLPQIPVASLNFTLTNQAFSTANSCIPATSTITLGSRSGASATTSSPWTGVTCDPAPTVVIYSPAQGSYTSQSTTNVAFFVNGSTTVPPGIACSVNGVPTNTPGLNSVPLSVGQNTILVVCTSVGGQSSASVSVIRDIQPPSIGPISVSFVSPTSARITYSASDDSGLAPECIPPSGSTIPLQPGPNQITVNCRDRAGNVATSVVTIVVDPPQPFSVSITSGPTGTITSPTATFSYQASEPLETTMQCPPGTVCPAVMVTRVTLSCSLDGAAGTPCPISNAYGGSYTTPPLAPGNHTFCVRGTRVADGAVAQDCRTFTVLSEPPPPPNVQCTVNGNTLTCTWPNTAGLVATCSLDGGPTTTCVSPWIRAGLAPGGHTARICFTSAAGDTACRSFTFVIDGFPPVVVITSPPSGSTTTASTATLTFTASGTGPITCTRVSPAVVPLTIGPNTITVSCSNAFGTSSATTVVTRTPLPFDPSFSQSVSGAGSLSDLGLTISFSAPAGSEGIRSATILEPAQVQPNFPAFGPTNGCPSSSITPVGSGFQFNSTDCAGVARVGQLTLSSPARSTSVVGDVYLVQSSPIPWLGVSFADGSYGVTQLVVPFHVVQDPACDPEGTVPCHMLVQLTVDGLPDVPQLSSVFTFDEADRTTSEGLIPGRIFAHEASVCGTATAKATLTSHSGATATRESTFNVPPCEPEE